MRKIALSLIVVAAGMTLASNGWAQEARMLVGKYVSWESWTTESASGPVAASSMEGESLETPNQTRKRLGLAPEAALPQAHAENPIAIEIVTIEQLAKIR